MVVDIIIILIFAISIAIAYVKGLSSIIYKIASWIVTIILVFVLCRPLTNLIIEKTSFDETISEKIQINLENNFKENLDNGIEIKAEDSNISNSVVNIINNYINEAKAKGSENIAKYVSDEISYIAVSAVVILALFIISGIISLIIKFVLEVIISLPLIGTMNKIGGIAYGIVRAFLIIYIILAIISLLSPTLADTGIIKAIKDSNIASIFYNDNIILKFLSK